MKILAPILVLAVCACATAPEREPTIAPEPTAVRSTVAFAPLSPSDAAINLPTIDVFRVGDESQTYADDCQRGDARSVIPNSLVMYHDYVGRYRASNYKAFLDLTKPDTISTTVEIVMEASPAGHIRNIFSVFGPKYNNRCFRQVSNRNFNFGPGQDISFVGRRGTHRYEVLGPGRLRYTYTLPDGKFSQVILNRVYPPNLAPNEPRLVTAR